MAAPRPARPGRTGLALTALAVLATACAAPAARDDSAGSPARPVTLTSGTVSTAAMGTASTAAAAEKPAPVRLRIPAIGVRAPVIALRLDAKGRLIAPKRFDVAGWNKSGPEPGEPGVAVIAGHVDSRTGPAVFYRLRRLRKGAKIHVDHAGGGTTTFTVTRTARYPKSRIPDREVYGTAKGVQLRLITCGGTFDRKRRSYRDNVVVFATR